MFYTHINAIVQGKSELLRALFLAMVLGTMFLPLFAQADGGGGGGGWPPTVTSFTSSAGSVPTNGYVTLSWVGSADANACVGGGPGFTTGNLISGSKLVGPLATGLNTFTLYCSNNYGSSVLSSLNVYAGVAVPAPVVTIGHTNPGTTYVGQMAGIAWSATDATSCTATAGLNFDTGGAVSGWSLPLVSTTPGTYPYSLSCTGVGGTGSATVNVAVTVPPPPPVVTFTANGQSPVTTISQNTSATLAWNAPDALGCTGTGFSTNSAISGSVPTGNLIIGDHPYSISCYNGSGTTDSALTVSASSLCAGSNCGQVCVNVSSVQPTVGQIDAQNGQVTIASKQIAFSFTAVTPGTPPNPPTITGPTTRVPNEIGVYTFTATDPDANTIRYLVDWDMNGTVDQILPAAGYVSSGTGQPVNKSWSPLGAKNFQAKTEDSNGMTSGWTAYIVTITTQCSDGINNDAAEDLLIDLLDLGCGGDPNDNSESPNPLPVCGNGQDDDFDGYIDFGGADPSCTTGTGPSEHPVSPKATLTCTLPSPCTISPGGSATLTWSSTGTPDSCKFADQGSTVSGNGTRSVSPGATATYDIFCTKGAENSTHEQATVTVRQPRVYIEANPEHVSPVGAPSTIGWSAQSVGTCSVTESDDAGNSTTIWGPVTPVSPSIDIATPTPAMVRNIKKSYTYTITCDGGAATAKVKVNPPAGFQEF